MTEFNSPVHEMLRFTEVKGSIPTIITENLKLFLDTLLSNYYYIMAITLGIMALLSVSKDTRFLKAR